VQRSGILLRLKEQYFLDWHIYSLVATIYSGLKRNELSATEHPGN